MTFCACGVFLAWALVVHARLADWRSDRTLWQSAAAVAPLGPRVWVNYGAILELAGDAPGAEAAYERALVFAADGRRGFRDRAVTTSLAASGLARLEQRSADPHRVIGYSCWRRSCWAVHADQR